MHEYSIASAIVDQVQRIAEEYNATKVKKVIVRASPYEMIIPELLYDAYEIITSEIPLMKDSKLELIIDKPAIICLDCGYEGPPTEEGDPEFAYNFKCPKCGSRDTHINIKQMIIETVDLEIPDMKKELSSQH